MSSFGFLNNVKTLAVVCLQFGDTGKGKIVDWLADWADVIVRGTGGANAGHTVCLGSKRYVLHLVPSGILHDGAGKINVIGGGTAVDPRGLVGEIRALRDGGIKCANLRLSHRAHLVLPQHLVLDRVRESNAGTGKIGTTGRGMGPVYADHYARIGLTINDLLNQDEFVRKLRRNLEEKVRLLKAFDLEVVRGVMQHEHLAGGAYYHPEQIFHVDAIVACYMEFARGLEPYIADTDQLVQSAVADERRILLEGAQGNLLSVDIGIQPYVTSSDCSVYGLARGAGLDPAVVDLTLGLTKGFYMTRVGAGPLPTELGGERSAAWCSASGISEAHELAALPVVSVNAEDEFDRGVAIRRAGAEYGSTTKRPRRIGWLDLPLLRYSLQQVPVPCELVLTKLDVLDECEEIKVCTSYEYAGPTYRVGGQTLQPGTVLEGAIPDCHVLAHCRPQYQTFPGWRSSTSDIRDFQDFPGALTNLIMSLENSLVTEYSQPEVRVLSVGADRAQTIVI